MIYNENVHMDVRNILDYINKFTKNIGIEQVHVHSGKVFSACMGMRRNFPHIEGIQKASTFKKVANFVAWFIQCSPIVTEFPPNSIKGLSGSFNVNAVVAFDIALFCLENSKINSCDGEKTVHNVLYVSDHSYADIIDALSQDCVTAESHYHLLARRSIKVLIVGAGM